MSKGKEVAHRSMGGFFFSAGLLIVYLGLTTPELRTESLPAWFNPMLATLLMVVGIFTAIYGLGKLIHRRIER